MNGRPPMGGPSYGREQAAPKRQATPGPGAPRPAPNQNMWWPRGGSLFDYRLGQFSLAVSNPTGQRRLKQTFTYRRGLTVVIPD